MKTLENESECDHQVTVDRCCFADLQIHECASLFNRLLFCDQGPLEQNCAFLNEQKCPSRLSIDLCVTSLSKSEISRFKLKYGVRYGSKSASVEVNRKHTFCCVRLCCSIYVTAVSKICRASINMDKSTRYVQCINRYQQTTPTSGP